MDSTDNSFALSAERRIKKSSDFVAVLKSRDFGSLRFSNEWFEARSMMTDSGLGIRFGFTVGKVNAKRSVDRVLVKRVLREAARQQIPVFSSLTRDENSGFDISLRLKKRFRGNGVESLPEVKKEMRKSADEVLARLYSALARRLESKGKA